MHAGMQTFLAPNSHYAWKVCANDGRNNPPGITCSPIRHFNTDNSVVGWWRFDESPLGPLCAGAPMGSGKTVCDYSGNNNHGVPNGGPIWLPPPDPMFLGGALNFDGSNDYVEISNVPSLNPGQITIEVNQRLQAIGVNHDNRFVSKISSPDSIDNTGYFFGFGFGNDLGLSIGNIGVVGFAGPADLGVWHHFVGTYDGGNGKVYSDNVLAITTPFAGTINSNSQPLWIGRTVRFDSFYNGTMSEMTIYSRAITGVEVSNSFHSL